VAQLVPQQERLSRLFARGGVVKVCGLREPEHAAAAAAAGADLIGFIFAPARRQVTPAAARACIDAARNAAPERTVLAVGVFVDAPLSEMTRIVEEAGIDALQLHGDEPPEALQNLAVPAVKAIRPRPGTDAARVAADINRYRWGASPPIGILVDGYTEEVSGGSGERADWRLARELGASFPILLAGGLDSENVGAAIREVRPLGVDVSSGVEIDGVKAAARIEEFIHSARQAFQHSGDRGRG
jgi:phosphoribosylanthranilate isomerase